MHEQVQVGVASNGVEAALLDGAVQPVIPNVAQQTAEATTVYERQHGNGEVYTGTAEDAKRICTAMGRLPLEQVGLLLKLQAIGKQKMSEKDSTAQTEPKRKTRTPEPQPDKTEAAAARADKQPIRKAEPALKATPRTIIELKVKPGKPIDTELPYRPPDEDRLPLFAPPAEAIETIPPKPHLEQTIPVAIADVAARPSIKPDLPLAAPPYTQVPTAPPEIIHRAVTQKVYAVQAEASLATPAEPSTTVELEAMTVSRQAAVEHTAEILAESDAGVTAKIAAPESLNILPPKPDAVFVNTFEKDLSIEVDALLVELGLAPAPMAETFNNTVEEESGSAVITASAPERLPDLQIVDEFATILLLKANSAPVAAIENAASPASTLQRVAEHIQQMEPERKQEAAILLQDIAQVVHSIREPQLTAAAETVETQETLMNNLEQLCIEVLKATGKPYAKVDVRHLMRYLLTTEDILSFDRAEVISHDAGTHERKQGWAQFIGTFTQTVAQHLPSHASVGQLALSSIR